MPISMIVDVGNGNGLKIATIYANFRQIKNRMNIDAIIEIV